MLSQERKEDGVGGEWSKSKKGRKRKTMIESLIVLNDGMCTSASMSCIDLSIASAELAVSEVWDVIDQYTIGSDHLPVITRFWRDLIQEL